MLFVVVICRCRCCRQRRFQYFVVFVCR